MSLSLSPEDGLAWTRSIMSSEFFGSLNLVLLSNDICHVTAIAIVRVKGQTYFHVGEVQRELER